MSSHSTLDSSVFRNLPHVRLMSRQISENHTCLRLKSASLTWIPNPKVQSRRQSHPQSALQTHTHHVAIFIGHLTNVQKTLPIFAKIFSGNGSERDALDHPRNIINIPLLLTKTKGWRREGRKECYFQIHWLDTASIRNPVGKKGRESTTCDKWICCKDVAEQCHLCAGFYRLHAAGARGPLCLINRKEQGPSNEQKVAGPLFFFSVVNTKQAGHKALPI